MSIIKCSIDKNNWYEVYIEYSISTNNAECKSTVAHALKIKQLTDDYDFSGTMNVTYYINGKAYSYNDNLDMNDKGDTGYTVTIISGTTTVNHDKTTGGASFKVSCDGDCNSGGYGPGKITLSEKTINIPKIPLYTLSVSVGSHTSVTVNRTSSGAGGSTGNISAGAYKLYYGDKLKVTFVADSNYKISKHTVNGTSFTSGKTHAVSGNVSVVSTASPQISTIIASNANVGSKTKITVTKYSSSYTHTITYSFGDLTGTICSKSKSKSISWTVPSSFYEKMPNEKTKKCTLTCTTYSGSTSLGTSTYTFTVTAPSSTCKPEITTATVVDTNTTTIALTGSNKKLIKYRSTAKCTVKAEAKNSATISKLKINKTNIAGTTSNGVTSGTKSYSKTSSTSYSFSTVDSRGYTSSKEIKPTIIEYIPLTCRPVVTRASPTGSAITLTFSGNLFRGSFGACSNTLTLKYRYKVSGGTYGSWTTIPSSKIAYGTSSYSSSSAITVGSDFDYKKSYYFQIRATDGGEVDGESYTLTSLTKTISVKKSIPVFDWGENDFNFNVDVKFPSGNNAICGTNTDGKVIQVLKPCNASDNMILGYGNYEEGKGTTFLYGTNVTIHTKNDLRVWDDSGETSKYYSLLGAMKAMSNAYEVDISVTSGNKGANYSNVDFSGYLIGNSLRISYEIERSSAPTVGDITNEKVATITVNHEKKIKSVYHNAFCNGRNGGVATFYTANREISSDEKSFAIDIYLSATTTGATKYSGYFILPVTLYTINFV